MLKITDTANTSNTLNHDSYQPEIVTDVNLSRDVPNTLEDNYYRCAICFWRISYGWLDFIVTISTVATTFLSSLATFGQLSDVTRTQLGISGLVTGSLAVFAQNLKLYAKRAIKTRKTMLKEVLIENAETEQSGTNINQDDQNQKHRTLPSSS